MVGCFEDYDYLKKIASPYFEILKDYPADLAVAEWFNKAFPPKIGYVLQAGEGTDMWH